MAKLMNKIFGRSDKRSNRVREEAAARQAAETVAELEQSLKKSREAALKEAARMEVLTIQIERSLGTQKVWVAGFDRETGGQVQGQKTKNVVAAVLCQEGESLRNALIRCSAREKVEAVYHGRRIWLAVREHSFSSAVFYTVVDVTQTHDLLRKQEEDKKRDPITGLFTEEAFLAAGNALLVQDRSACAFHMQVKPLHNLPVTPTGGTPEAFLRSCSRALQTFGCAGIYSRTQDNALCGVLYDYDEEQLPALLQQLQDTLAAQTVLLEPVGVQSHTLVLGTARYPVDCGEFSGLMRRARLATYAAGKQGKDGICAYKYDRLLLNGQTYLQELLEKKQVEFLLQPVIRTANAKVEGYELQMVSRHSRLESMEQVMSLADFLGRKQELEQLLWFGGLAAIKAMVENGSLVYDASVWVPSVMGTYLSDGADARFVEENFDYLKHIVLELSEQGLDNMLCAGIKRNRARQWGAATAICCDSLDQNAQLSLCLLQPDLIRVQASAVRGIASDAGKQKSFRSLRRYADLYSIRLLAEGIENAQDLQTAVQLGADFLQGDYLGTAAPFPSDIPERRVQQVGQAQYGKRG